MATAGALIDVQGAKLTLRFGKEEVMFDMRHPTHIPSTLKDCMRIDSVGQCVSEIYDEKPVEYIADKSEGKDEWYLYKSTTSMGITTRWVQNTMEM